jgi:hypothetical protein
MSDVEQLVAAILAAALSSKNETTPSAEGYVDSYESVLEALKKREREKRSKAAAQDDSWVSVNEALKKKKNADADRT